MSAVLSATVVELARTGYDSFRVGTVASAAGVNKTSVYRRWPNKLALVAAALRARPVVTADPPNLGSLRADLVATLEVLCDYCASIDFRDTSMLLHTSNPAIDQLLTMMRGEYYGKYSAIVTRAVQRGELSPVTDAPAFLRHLVTEAVGLTKRDRTRPTRAALERLIERALAL